MEEQVQYNLTEKQQQTRSRGIGGSDVAPILGLSPWKTAYQVWEEKTGMGQPQEETPAMAYGKLMEGTLRQWYSNETGHIVTVPKMGVAHPIYDFLRASLDGITEDGRVLEIKTARFSKDWGEPGTDEIPIYYMTQVQHYLMVYSLDVADVVVSIAGSMPQIYEVPADKSLQQMILEEMAAFWRLVENQTPPVPVSYSDMLARFGGKSIPNSVTATMDAIEAHAALKEVQEKMKALEVSENNLKALLMGELGANEVLLGIDGKPLVTWKLSKPSLKFDAKAFQLAEPDDYKKYLTEQPGSRRFLLK